MVQAILHRTFHDGRHALPVQSVLASRSLPTQLPRQSRHRIRQRRGHSSPRVRPGKVLHPQTAPGAVDSTGPVAQFQWQFPHRQIAPFPRFAYTVHLPTALPADPTTQQPTSQSVDVDDHVPLGLLHSGNSMRFQPQLLSEKRFDEHLDPLPFGGLITTTLKRLDESGIQAAYSDGNLLRLNPFNLNCTFRIRTFVWMAQDHSVQSDFSKLCKPQEHTPM